MIGWVVGSWLVGDFGLIIGIPGERFSMPLTPTGFVIFSIPQRRSVVASSNLGILKVGKQGCTQVSFTKTGLDEDN